MPLSYSSKDFQKVGVKGFVPEPSATAPAAPANGQLWTDSTSAPSVLKRWDGTRWETLGEILDGSITTAKLADGAVTTLKLADGAVTGDKLADDSVDGAAIVDGEVGTAALADASVTDAKLAGSIALGKLATDPLARANHTGTQTAATISDFDTAVQASSLDQLAVAAADLDLGGNRATNAGAPQDANDLATMAYVDASRAGFRGTKDPVRVVADPGFDTANPPAAIDGVTLANGDRFLVPDAGIFVFNGAGTAATADNTGVADGTTVAVAEGTDAGYIYIQRATSGADWGVFSAGGLTYTAGTGITQTGTQFSLGTVAVNLGGTGATTAAQARVNLSASGAYGETIDAADLPGGGASAIVTHGLNTIYIGLWGSLDSTGQAVDLDWRVVDANSVEIITEVALPDDLNVCVVGA